MRRTSPLLLIALFAVACGRDVEPPSGTGGAASGGAGGENNAVNAGGTSATATCDPSTESLAYLDLDGDQAGDPRTATCLPVGELPHQYAAVGNDCDDFDATKGPWVADVPGDGVDRDCDSLDGVVDCRTSPDACPCATLANETVDGEPTCAGFDVALLGVEACGGGCGAARRFAVIANRGAEPIFVAIALGWSSGPDVLWYEGLEAGAVSAPIWVPAPPAADDVLTAIALDPGDCDPTNNTLPAPDESAALCAK